MKSDTQLKKDVEAELEREPNVNAARICIEARGGVVTLSGHVETCPEKWAAGIATQRVSGVIGLAVGIEVNAPFEQLRLDSDLAGAVVAQLRKNVSVPHDSVKVRVETGWITLSGIVDWDYQRCEASTAIRNLAGVKGISNVVELKRKTPNGNFKARIEATRNVHPS